MELKIFTPGFEAVEFNEFCRTHITFRTMSLDDGSVHVFYKDANKIGNQPIELIEKLDSLVKQAEIEIHASTLNLAHTQNLLDEARVKLEKADAKSKEWDRIDDEIKSYEKQVKLDNATISEREQQIVVFKADLPRLLALIEA